jgi:hypothetical protein
MVPRALAAGLLACATAAGLACGAREPEAEGDCVERLFWRGVEYAGHPHRPAFAERLGATTTRACGKPHQRVAIHRVRDVHPSVAIAVKRDEPGGRRRFLALGPGYVVQSPRHPLHGVLFGSDERPAPYRGLVCRSPRTLTARVVRAPLGEERWVRVRGMRPGDRRFLRGRNVDGNLSIFADSVIEGLDRGDIPYVEAGKRVRLALRACRGGPAAEEGLRGLTFLVVDRMSDLAPGR